ncbi:MAG: pyridoxamine 5'-phosphate oxidase family protein [Candidatus Dormibacteraeota bacterium]|nr:pyridoxamine 5'-phosphate oxidase family protein [Candidatus Dormibacteraeota bacterium]
MAAPAHRSGQLEIRRHPERTVRDRAAIRAALDRSYVCHVGFVWSAKPWVIPSMYARDGERLLLHGSPLSRMMRTLADGIDVCVTVTRLNGVVLARSAFNHSLNYESVVVVGRARALLDDAAKMRAMQKLVEHVVPGRWDEVRPPSAKELATTLVLELPLDRVSMKARHGPPKDTASDRATGTWGGELPLLQMYEQPLPDALVSADARVPPSVRALVSAGRNGRGS